MTVLGTVYNDHIILCTVPQPAPQALQDHGTNWVATEYKINVAASIDQIRFTEVLVAYSNIISSYNFCLMFIACTEPV